MAQALELAALGKGSTRPNPCVGALLAQGGQVLARGWHQMHGGPHAEVNCLADARAKGVDPAQCEMYVTLEPCNHHGKTPPCTKAVLDAGVKRVLVGCADPNPRVEGGGAAMLRANGVDVVVGVLEQACRDMIADFVTWQFTARPYVTVKMAATLDGRIATRTGHSAWVSGPESRGRVHALRAGVDAVMVGGRTLRQDNPRLTARLEGRDPAKQPLAVVVTSILPEPGAGLTLIADRPGQTVFLTHAASAASSRAEALRELGVRVWELPLTGDCLDIRPGLERLRAEAGCLTLLCEGGGRLAMSLATQGLMDELVYVLAPKILGDATGVPVFSGADAERMDQALKLRLAGLEQSGQDLMLTYRPEGAA